MRKQILTAFIIASSLIGCLEPPTMRGEGESCSADDTCGVGLSCLDGICTDLDDQPDMATDALVIDDAGPEEDMGGPEDVGSDDDASAPADMSPADIGSDIGPIDMEQPACGGACPDEMPFCDVTADQCTACIGDESCANGVCLAGASPAENACVECVDSPHCDTGVCDAATNTCVPCIGDGDCGDQVCKIGATTAENACVECLATADCAAGVCDTSTNSCVSCLVDGDCPDPSASACNDQNQCVGCIAPDECSHLPATSLCDEAAMTCVQCFDETPADRAACGGNSCNPETNTCTMTPVADRGRCETCVADSECETGHACVPMAFKGTARASRYCLPIKSGSCPEPFVSTKTELNASGDTVDVCSVVQSLTTCEAYLSLFVGADCPTGDAECGDPALMDGVCDAGSCSYACGVTGHCPPGLTCAGSNPMRCVQ